MERLNHPLLNPEILSMIFDRCDLEDLPSVRRVSKLWRRESLATWRARNVYSIQDDEHGFNGSSQSQALTQLDKLLPLLGTPADAESRYRLQSKPPQKLVIHRWRFSENPGRKLEFWNSCGSWIKVLSMTHCDFPDDRIVDDILFRQTPNLEQLTLRQNRGPIISRRHQIKDDDDDALVVIVLQENLTKFFLESQCKSGIHEFPITWARLFKHYPNLKTLGFEYTPAYGDDDNDEALYLGDLHQLLLTIKDSVQPKMSLKELDIFNAPVDFEKFPPATAALFRELRLPLETLKVDIGFDTPEEVIQDILESHSETLGTLKCFRLRRESDRNRGDGDIWFRFNHFPFRVYFGTLHNLELIGQMVTDFRFLKFTPNLKRLAIYIERSKIPRRVTSCIVVRSPLGVVERGWADARLDCLETLEGDFDVGGWEDIAVLGDWMPNLRALKVPLDQFTFPAVCRTWNLTLRELHLHDKSIVGDCTLTGIPTPPAPGLEPDPYSEPYPLNMNRRKPNITNLQGLESFSYTAPGSTLTDHAVEHGFVALPHLRTLRVRLFRSLGFGNERILKERVGNLQIFSGYNRPPNSP